MVSWISVFLTVQIQIIVTFMIRNMYIYYRRRELKSMLTRSVKTTCIFLRCKNGPENLFQKCISSIAGIYSGHETSFYYAALYPNCSKNTTKTQ